MKTNAKQKTSHTPGPWVINEDDDCFLVEYRQDTPVGFARTLAKVYEPINRENGRANARLIAAAPDMEKRIAELEAVNKDLLEAAKRAERAASLGLSLGPEGLQLLRAAIAKAQGGK